MLPVSFPFPVVPGGRVAMIAVWKPLPPGYGQEATVGVAVFPVAFGTHAACCIESCVQSTVLVLLDIFCLFTFSVSFYIYAYMYDIVGAVL